MIFTRENYLVQFYLKLINEKKTTKEEVPMLFNLRDVVLETLG